MRVRRRLAAVILLLAGAWGGPAAMAASVADLAGTWRSAEILSSQGIDLEPVDLDRTISAVGEGFSMAWTVPGTGDVEFVFVPGPRPGMFQIEPHGKGLLSRMFSPATGNPLQGDRLVWARQAGDALVVYGFALDGNGRFVVDRQSQTRDGDGLRVEFTRMRQGEPQGSVVARLRRWDG